MLKDGARLIEIENERALLRARRNGLQEAMTFCYEAIRALDTAIMETHEAWGREFDRLLAANREIQIEASEAEGCTHGPPASAGELPG